MKKLCLFMAGALLLAVPASAQDTTTCMPRADLVKLLKGSLHQAPIAIGMISDKLIMEIFVSDRGEWTEFWTNADLISCVRTVGENWNWDTSAFDAAKKKGPKA
jgi:hypothetical protein